MRKSQNWTIINVENGNKGVENVSEIERSKRFLEFIWESDRDFYDKYLVNLTEEELERFMKDNADFAEGIKWEDMKRTT